MVHTSVLDKRKGALKLQSSDAEYCISSGVEALESPSAALDILGC